MARVLELRTAAQVRAISSPGRRDVFEALMDRAEAPGGASAREIAERTGMSVAATHYHLGQLTRAGFVDAMGARRTGARPEKLFAPACDRVELTRGRRGPAFVRELVRGVRLLLRRAEREYERSAPDGAFRARPTVARVIGWMSPEELDEARRLTAALEELVLASDEHAARDGAAGRERVAFTIVSAPIASREDG